LRFRTRKAMVECPFHNRKGGRSPESPEVVFNDHL
jgi:hypothetical protein